MSTEQEQWAAQICEIPTVFRGALLLNDDHAIRHRPTAGEWSAVEVVVEYYALHVWNSNAAGICLVRDAGKQALTYS